jgi:2,3-diketo-5-methylthio-1-phosphopentane phosphatase
MGILVSDFDGTLAREDFYQLTVQQLLPPGSPDFLQDYWAGRCTHFEVLQRCYAAIRASEEEVLRVVDSLQLEPELAQWLKRLGQVGWKVVVASAGCLWYIRHLLEKCGAQLEVHASPGRFVAEQGLLMELPLESPYYSPSHGIDKAAVVRAMQQLDPVVAFAGDGESDLPAARLVPAQLRFATSALAAALQRDRLPFRRFDRWAEVAEALIQEEAGRACS